MNHLSEEQPPSLCHWLRKCKTGRSNESAINLITSKNNYVSMGHKWIVRQLWVSLLTHVRSSLSFRHPLSRCPETFRLTGGQTAVGFIYWPRNTYRLHIHSQKITCQVSGSNQECVYIHCNNLTTLKHVYMQPFNTHISPLVNTIHHISELKLAF